MNIQRPNPTLTGGAGAPRTLLAAPNASSLPCGFRTRLPADAAGEPPLQGGRLLISLFGTFCSFCQRDPTPTRNRPRNRTRTRRLESSERKGQSRIGQNVQHPTLNTQRPSSECPQAPAFFGWIFRVGALRYNLSSSDSDASHPEILKPCREQKQKEKRTDNAHDKARDKGAVTHSHT